MPPEGATQDPPSEMWAEFKEAYRKGLENIPYDAPDPDDAPLPDLPKPPPTALRPLVKTPLRVGIFGEYSGGKSTLVNSLVGGRVFEVGVQPVTARVQLVAHPDRSTRGQVKQSTGPLFALGLELWDTPGFNSEDAAHARAARGALAKVDRAVVVLRVEDIGSRSTTELYTKVASALRARSLPAPWVVLTRFDTQDWEDEDEADEVLESLREHTSDARDWYPLDARDLTQHAGPDWLTALTTEVEAHVQQTLVAEVGVAVLHPLREQVRAGRPWRPLVPEVAQSEALETVLHAWGETCTEAGRVRSAARHAALKGAAERLAAELDTFTSAVQLELKTLYAEAATAHQLRREERHLARAAANSAPVQAESGSGGDSDLEDMVTILGGLAVLAVFATGGAALPIVLGLGAVVVVLGIIGACLMAVFTVTADFITLLVAGGSAAVAGSEELLAWLKGIALSVRHARAQRSWSIRRRQLRGKSDLIRPYYAILFRDADDAYRHRLGLAVPPREQALRRNQPLGTQWTPTRMAQRLWGVDPNLMPPLPATGAVIVSNLAWSLTLLMLTGGGLWLADIPGRADPSASELPRGAAQPALSTVQTLATRPSTVSQPSSPWSFVCTPRALQGLDREALRLRRFELFARHGMSFIEQDLRRHFEAQPWYRPAPHGSDGNLSVEGWDCLARIDAVIARAPEPADAPAAPPAQVDAASTGRTAELLRRGRALLVDGKLEAAQEVLEACLVLDPEQVPCHWELGWVHWQRKDFAEVVRTWETVKRLEPGHPEVGEWLGKARGR